jgi:hypothetical protein
MKDRRKNFIDKEKTGKKNEILKEIESVQKQTKKDRKIEAKISEKIKDRRKNVIDKEKTGKKNERQKFRKEGRKEERKRYSGKFVPPPHTHTHIRYNCSLQPQLQTFTAAMQCAVINGPAAGRWRCMYWYTDFNSLKIRDRHSRRYLPTALGQPSDAQTCRRPFISAFKHQMEVFCCPLLPDC